MGQRRAVSLPIRRKFGHTAQRGSAEAPIFDLFRTSSQRRCTMLQNVVLSFCFEASPTRNLKKSQSCLTLGLFLILVPFSRTSITVAASLS